MTQEPLHDLYGLALPNLSAWQPGEIDLVRIAAERISLALAQAHDSDDPELGRGLFRAVFTTTRFVRVRAWTTSVFGWPPPFPQGAAWAYRDHVWAADAVFRQPPDDVTGAFIHELGHVWDTRRSPIGAGSLSIEMIRAVQARWTSRLGAPLAGIARFTGSRGPFKLSQYDPGPRGIHARVHRSFISDNQYQDWAEAFKWWVLTRDRTDPYAAEPGGRWQFVEQAARRIGIGSADM